jgi:hypothetical protein
MQVPKVVLTALIVFFVNLTFLFFRGGVLFSNFLQIRNMSYLIFSNILCWTIEPYTKGKTQPFFIWKLNAVVINLLAKKI